MTVMTAASAKALLVNARDRARMIHGETKRVMMLRPETFLAVLRAEPGLIRFEQLKFGAGEHFPFFGDWRIDVANTSLESSAFRAKVVGPTGSYLEQVRP